VSTPARSRAARHREVAVPVATVWTGPDAPRPGLDDAAVADLPDTAAWMQRLDAAGAAEDRLGLHGRTLTQLLLGEPAVVLAERDGWSQVVAPDQASSADPGGYPGWVRTAHLAAPADPQREAGHGGAVRATVAVPAADCRIDETTLSLSCGTSLPVSGLDRGELEVPLADGRTGRLDLAGVRLTHDRQQVAYGADDLLATARQFLGLRYLWGGTSAWGLDCSGLVHLVLRAHGVLLPRDAFDQAVAAAVEPVPLDDVRPGDLYFFARPGARIHHVGFASGPDGQWMLHAPEGGVAAIEDAPMAPERRALLVGAGRVRKPDCQQLATYPAEDAAGTAR
jgi:cell wall-associated NlpC family hydrolase